MKKIMLFLIASSIFILSTGCTKDNISSTDFNDSSLTNNQERVVSVNSKEQNAVSEGVPYSQPNLTQSEQNQSQEENNVAMLSKEDAVKIAFAEAQKYQDEYKLVIPDSAISNYRLELKYTDQASCYLIVFNDLLLKDGKCVSAIGVEVDAVSGNILNVYQYK